MKDDLPLIKLLVQDAGFFKLEAEVVGSSNTNYTVPAAEMLNGIKPLLIVDEIDSVLLDKRCTFADEWFVLGLTV